MVQVSSAAIRELDYDPDTLELHVTFHHGGTYTHGGVPPDLYERFLAAPSKGSFYNAELKHQYPR